MTDHGNPRAVLSTSTASLDGAVEVWLSGNADKHAWAILRKLNTECWLVINDRTYGPFDDVAFLSDDPAHQLLFATRLGEQLWIVTPELGVQGPFSGEAVATGIEPGSARWWVVLGTDTHVQVVVNGSIHGPFDKLFGIEMMNAVHFLNGPEQWVFAARIGEEWHVHTALGPSEPFSEPILPFVISSNARVWSILVKRKDVFHLLSTHGELGPFPAEPLLYTSCDGAVLAAVSEGHIFTHGAKHGAFDRVGGVTIAPGGVTLAFTFRRGDEWFLHIGDTQVGPFEAVSDISLSDDGKEWSAWTRSAGEWSLRAPGFNLVAKGAVAPLPQPWFTNGEQTVALLGRVDDSGASAAWIATSAGLDGPCSNGMVVSVEPDYGWLATLPQGEMYRIRRLHEQWGPFGPFDSASRALAIGGGHWLMMTWREKYLTLIRDTGTAGPFGPFLRKSRPPFFSQGGAHAGTIVNDASGQGLFIVIDANVMGPFSQLVPTHKPIFSADGKGWMFAGRKTDTDMQIISTAGKWGPFEDVASIGYVPSEGPPIAIVRTESLWHVFRDGLFFGSFDLYAAIPLETGILVAMLNDGRLTVAQW